MVLFSYQRLAAICFLLRSLTGASTLMKSTTVASVPADVLVGPSVALIGCGPSGMFFLHALATRRKELSELGDHDALNALPQVTTFEMSSGPGGVWKSNRGRSSRKNTTDHDWTQNMYEGLWTNGPKEAMEFSDYTYDDHFKTQLPVYLPRKLVYEYIMARVTQHGDIFEDVWFNTYVQSVSYDGSINKFVIKTKHLDGTGTNTTQYFDKCIWAAGVNGKPKLIPELYAKLSNFQGRIIHSSEMGQITDAVKGKHILMVGGSYSAEDLALQCIKLGAEKIYISSRGNDDFVHWTTTWPDNKVTILLDRVPCNVTDGNTIQFCNSEYHRKKDEVMEEYDGIDMIIMCTGYEENTDFLDPDLNGDLYRNVVLLENPNMLFIYDDGQSPLLEIDVRAWLALAFFTGRSVIPTKQQMMRQNDFRSQIFNSRREYTAVLNLMALDMTEGKYPVSFGTLYELNDMGKKLEQIIYAFHFDRQNNINPRMTFRDANPRQYSSYLTGTSSIPLKGNWLVIDDDGEPFFSKDMVNLTANQ